MYVGLDVPMSLNIQSVRESIKFERPVPLAKCFRESAPARACAKAKDEVEDAGAGNGVGSPCLVGEDARQAAMGAEEGRNTSGDVRVSVLASLSSHRRRLAPSTCVAAHPRCLCRLGLADSSLLGCRSVAVRCSRGVADVILRATVHGPWRGVVSS